MQPLNILVLGGTGFIGQHICSRLSGDMHRLRVPTRSRRHGRDIWMLPTIDVVEADIHDDAALEALIGPADVVINLVGVLHSEPGEPYGETFRRVHVDLPRRVGERCRALGGKRLLHMSALGADEQRGGLPSAYLRSKADGERALAAIGLQHTTIFRPSVVFGPGDAFLNTFASLQRWFPVMPLACARAQFQPVYVGDVARAFASCVANPSTAGRTYELAGPDIYTLRELVALAGEISGNPRPIIALPDSLGRLQARVLELMPGAPLMTRDNLASMSKPNIATGPMAPELGMAGVPITSVAPEYLRPGMSEFNAERARARR